MNNILALIPLLLVLFPRAASAQSQDFRLPIEGEPGKDFFIVNYVDHDEDSEEISDYRCGTKTYDGHQGTDFTLASFAHMDAGVGVLAAADGTVFYAVDSLFDRNKESVVERGFGNWIGIAHAEGYRTYYAHLRTGSALVQPGDTVQAGQQIALVGSSGNSSDPHLHFEVWKIDTTLRDPFGPGDCTVQNSLWKDQPAYDTDYRLIDHGLLGWVPDLDTLRERPAGTSLFSPPDTAVAFWAHQLGLRRGDIARIEWRRTFDDQLWFEYEFPAATQDWWYHYFWSWIALPPNDDYVVRYFVNNRMTAEREFTVQGVTGVKDRAEPSGLTVRSLSGQANILVITRARSTRSLRFAASLYDMTGARVARISEQEYTGARTIIDLDTYDLPAGNYMLQIEHGGTPATFPVHLSETN